MNLNQFYDYKTNIVFWEEVDKISEVIRLKETPQNQIWHKEGNAYNHTIAVTKVMQQAITELNINDELRQKILIFLHCFMI